MEEESYYSSSKGSHIPESEHFSQSLPSSTQVMSQEPQSPPREEIPENRQLSQSQNKQRKSVFNKNTKEEEHLRLKVWTIELENFKSYYGRKVIGPFDEEFSAVVGPNGSGKSNLLESLIFIFGHRASRMRLKNLTELIHNSNDHPNCSYASVAVHFYEVDSNENEQNRFSIRRTVYQETSGTKYFIDEMESTKNEVVELLLKKGVDLINNRFMILQGEVETIASMDPKGRNEDNPGLLEYLEDIIGSNTDVERIEKFKQQIDELLILKAEKHISFDDAKKRLESLSKHKEQVFNLLNTDKEILCIKHCQLSLQKFSNNNVRNKIIKKIEELKVEKKKINHELNQLEKQNKDISDKIKENKAQQDILQSKKQLFEKDNSKLLNQHSNLSTLIQSYAEKQVNYKKELAEMSNTLEDILNQKKSKEEKIPKTRETIKENQEKIDQLTERRNKIMSNKHSEIEVIKSEKRLVEVKIANLNHLIEENQQEIIEQSNKIKKQDALSAALNEDIQKFRSKFTSIENAMENIRADLKSNTEGLENAQAHYESMKLQLQNARIKKEELTQKKRDLENWIRSNPLEDKARQAQEEVEKIASMLQELQNRLGGKVFGKLGNLGSIPPQFDKAISAVGAKFNSVLVDTDIVSSQAINYLRSKTNYSALFIIIDKIRKIVPVMNQPFRAPPNSKRLFDLCKFNHENAKIGFYFILKNTLVVKNLTEAAKINKGKQKYVIVTLDGSILYPNGAIQGGGTARTGAVNTGDMRRVFNTEGLRREQMEKKKLLTQIIEAIQICQKDIFKIQETMRELHREIHTVFPNLIHNNRTKIGVFEDELKAKQAKLQQKLREEQELKGNNTKDCWKIITELRKKNHNLAQTKNELENKKDDYDDKLVKILGNEYKDITETLNIALNNKDELEKVLAEYQGSLNNYINQIDKKSKKIKESEQELGSLSQKIEDSKKKQEQMIEKSEHIMVTIVGVEQKIEALENEIHQISENEKELTNKLSSLRSEKINFASSINKFESSKEQANSKDELIQNDINKNLQKYLEQESNFKLMEDIIDQEIRAKEMYLDQKQLNLSHDLTSTGMVKVVGGRVIEENGRMVNPEEDDSDSDSEGESEESVLSIASSDKDEIGQLNVTLRNKKRTVGNDEIYMQKTPKEDYTDEEMKKLYQDNIKDDLHVLIVRKNKEKNAMKGDDSILNQYKEMMSQVIEHQKDYQRAREKVNVVRRKRDELQKKRLDKFKAGFDFIAQKLKEVYQRLTGQNGNADLELYDSHNPFAQGINYSVRPPGKGWKTIGKLSGGERTLASLALIFALHFYKPTPIYVMDEIDAALDFQNVDIVGKFITERSKEAQFIVISLRESMFTKCRKMIGVHKVNNKSGIVTLDMRNLLENIFKRAKENVEIDLNEDLSIMNINQRNLPTSHKKALQNNHDCLNLQQDVSGSNEPSVSKSQSRLSSSQKTNPGFMRRVYQASQDENY